MCQIGYCLGGLFWVSLSDSIDNHRLISTLIFYSGVALLAAALSQGMVIFLTAMFFMGLFSCSVQIIIPLCVGLASEKERGQVVGLVISGALLGIVLSRPTASWVTGLSDWRTMFFIATGFMLVVAALIFKLPKTTPVANGISYPQMLHSMLKLLVHQQGLKKRLVLMAMVFMSFTLCWATELMTVKASINSCRLI